MKRKIIYAGIILIILLGLVGSCRNAGKWLVKDDCPSHADAIVILMGSIADRTLQAYDLYQRKVSDKIIIVESSMGAYKLLEEKGVNITSNITQCKNALISLGVRPEHIVILPGNATSTIMEALIVRDYISINPQLEKLIIVSSASHTRRASLIFNAGFNNMNHPVKLYCCPSHYTGFNGLGWWKDRGTIETVFLENLKIGAFLLFERRQLIFQFSN